LRGRRESEESFGGGFSDGFSDAAPLSLPRFRNKKTKKKRENLRVDFLSFRSFSWSFRDEMSHAGAKKTKKIHFFRIFFIYYKQQQQRVVSVKKGEASGAREEEIQRDVRAFFSHHHQAGEKKRTHRVRERHFLFFFVL
jgi:hypothetical protein